MATGPSLAAADVDLVRASGLPVIAINDNYRMAPWADVLYACDGSWWKIHYQAVRKQFRGHAVTQDEEFRGYPGVVWVQSIDGAGLAPDKLVTGENSGYQAVNLAYLLGYDRVLLLGYDMQGRGDHWFGEHPDGLQKTTNYERFLSNFERMTPERFGVEVINCTRSTALRCFPTMQLEEALQKWGSNGSSKDGRQ